MKQKETKKKSDTKNIRQQTKKVSTWTIYNIVCWTKFKAVSKEIKCYNKL